MLQLQRSNDGEVERAAGLLTARFGPEEAVAYAYRQADAHRRVGEPKDAMRWNRIACKIRARAREKMIYNPGPMPPLGAPRRGV
jgi:hypothetical protein